MALGYQPDGCQTHRIGDLTLVANRSIPIELPVLPAGIVGEDCAIDGFGVPSLDDAIDEAQAQVPGANALTNAKIGLRVEPYLLATQRCFTVEGDAVAIESEP